MEIVAVKVKKITKTLVSRQKIAAWTSPVNIGDFKEIMKYGVMSTPALVIDDHVVATGRMLSVEQIEKFINERMK